MLSTARLRKSQNYASKPPIKTSTNRQRRRRKLMTSEQRKRLRRINVSGRKRRRSFRQRRTKPIRFKLRSRTRLRI